MRSIRLIAPFRCQLDINTPLVHKESEDYHSFLSSLKYDLTQARNVHFSTIPDGVEVETLQHATPRALESQFVSLDQVGSLFRSPKYLSLTFGPALKSTILDHLQRAGGNADGLCDMSLSAELAPLAESIVFDVYDNSLAIMTLDITVSEYFPENYWGKLDEWTTHLVFYFLDSVYTQYVLPTLKALNRYAFSKGVNYLHQAKDYLLYHDMVYEEGDSPLRPKLMWVNRTFICPRKKIDCEWAFRNMDSAKAITVDHAIVHLTWGNNIIETTHHDRTHDLSPVWQGMYLAQYYYAVLDMMSKNLSRYIGTTYDRKSSKSLKELSYKMDVAIGMVTFTLMKYKDLYLELQGTPRKIFQKLESEWDFSALYENVLRKNELCKTNVERLNQFINQRNDVRVQLVLAIVAGVGIVNFMLDLSSYAMQLLQNHYHDTSTGMINMAQYYTPNVMLWIGAVIAIAVSIFVAANRPR